MFLKKAAIITLSALFLTAGCTATSTPASTTSSPTTPSPTTSSPTASDQSEKISALQTELKKAQKETAELNEKLAQQMKDGKAKSDKAATKKSSNKHAYQDKTILGQAEWIYVSKAKQNFKARIDTGAATSSINAVDIKRFERDGKKWVKFNITHAKNGKKQIIEAPIVRIAKIVQSSKPGVETERPVVKLHVRIGDIATISEFTLTNRMHMEYAVLIGRTFIRDVSLVDVSQDYIHPKYKAKTK